MNNNSLQPSLIMRCVALPIDKSLNLQLERVPSKKPDTSHSFTGTGYTPGGSACWSACKASLLPGDGPLIPPGMTEEVCAQTRPSPLQLAPLLTAPRGMRKHPPRRTNHSCPLGICQQRCVFSSRSLAQPMWSIVCWHEKCWPILSEGSFVCIQLQFFRIRHPYCGSPLCVWIILWLEQWRYYV